MPTDDTMQQVIRMVQAGWDIRFSPSPSGWRGGIIARHPSHPDIAVSSLHDDIPAAWARLVTAWERQVQE